MSEDKVDDFLRYSFSQKVPLHLLMMVAEDRNFIEKIFDPCEEL